MLRVLPPYHISGFQVRGTSLGNLGKYLILDY